jgi:membrane associated rhomboid family serine protease
MSDNSDPTFGSFAEPPKKQPILNLPRAVSVLVYVIIAVHVIRLFLPDRLDMSIVIYFSVFPIRYEGLFEAGLSFSEIAESLATFITYMFLHADWMHLILNMAWLSIFGSVVARRLGSDFSGLMRFYYFFALCGVAGAYVHVLLYPTSTVPMIGASAAISGLMAGTLRVMFVPPGYFQSRVPSQNSMARRPLAAPSDSRIVIFALVFIVTNIIFGTTGMGVDGEDASIAWQAHLGGFFAGLFTFGLFVKK